MSGRLAQRACLVSEGKARIRSHPRRYVDHIYGKDELGGRSYMYLSPVPFDKVDFPTLDAEPVAELSETVATYGTPSLAVGVAALLDGLYDWFVTRTGSAEAQSTTDHR